MDRRIKIVLSLLLLIAAIVPISGNSCWNEQMASKDFSFSATATDQFSPLVSGEWDMDSVSPNEVVRLGEGR